MNLQRVQLNKIVADIVAAYGSTSEPSWSFVSHRVKRNLHQDVIARLAATFRVEETTDINVDTSRTLSVTTEPGESIGVRLSLVGRYACLGDAQGDVLTDEQLASGKRIEPIQAILVVQDLAILSREFLDQTIPFDGAPTDLYRILFSEDMAT